ncbi:hypothetical protein SS50377_23320 [Spironucleus salmonicida]|uniref:Uncharacterized protein n=1 Tax=Spironucleus salmonicida TaxID=348837 RepID=V6M1X2_9EUKA|nr:hypothetical protein SS50377_23320 [Spironucleus salmonicida]|eukprot:EST47189.1 Hypothetical protein SS50377_jh002 [Spironucleus salmonicida]
MKPPSHPSTPLIPILNFAKISAYTPPTRQSLSARTTINSPSKKICRTSSPSKALRNASISHSLGLDIYHFNNFQSQKANMAVLSARWYRDDKQISNEFSNLCNITPKKRPTLLVNQLQLYVQPITSIRAPQIKMVTKGEYHIIFVQACHNNGRLRFLLLLQENFQQCKIHQTNKSKITESMINRVEFVSQQTQNKGILQQNNQIQQNLAFQYLQRYKSDIHLLFSYQAEHLINYLGFLKWQNGHANIFQVFINEKIPTQQLLLQTQNAILFLKTYQ